jgi:TIR domain
MTSTVISVSFEEGLNMSGEGLTGFISYSHEDRDFAKRLKRVLSKALNGQAVRGVSDDVDVNEGAQWDERLLHAIRDAKVMVLILSPRTLQSATVPSEYGVALVQDKPVISGVPPKRRLPHNIQLPLRRSDFVHAGKLTDDEMAQALSERLAGLAAHEAPR